ncbi:hypothetical protein CASFOL_004540 [Castilleja foliolosa]|uniref:Uncharacterized protein n=1 Tax=Castilleja foliolosa TaxID=1961234 RepID=A0ABD3EAR1_9LAMI
MVSGNVFWLWTEFQVVFVNSFDNTSECAAGFIAAVNCIRRRLGRQNFSILSGDSGALSDLCLRQPLSWFCVVLLLGFLAASLCLSELVLVLAFGCCYCIIIDADDYKNNVDVLDVPMFVHHTEAMMEEIDRMDAEIEMEDVDDDTEDEPAEVSAVSS